MGSEPTDTCPKCGAQPDCHPCEFCTLAECDALRSRLRSAEEVVERLEKALKRQGAHARDCRAYKQLGRFGSRTGLLWQESTDAKACDCGLGAALAAAAERRKGGADE